MSSTITRMDGTLARYSVNGACGDVFETDDDFDGTVLTIEVRSESEGYALAALIDSQARATLAAAQLMRASQCAPAAEERTDK